MICANLSSLISNLVIEATPVEFRRAYQWLEKQAATFGMPSEQLYRMDSCLSETLANVLDHGGEAAHAAPIVLQLQCLRDENSSKALLTISSTGPQFDPFKVTLPPSPTALDQAFPGGLGLLMLRRFSDTQSYQYYEGRNHLTFTVHWKEN